MDTALGEFRRLILDELFPAFCRGPRLNFHPHGFEPNWAGVSEEIAANFLRAVSVGLVEDLGEGTYRTPHSSSVDNIFWECPPRTRIPRRVTLSLEPVISIAVLAKIHFDLGWPKELIGTQSKDYAFDVMTFMPEDFVNEHIACEVKSTVRQFDRLIRQMKALSVNLQQDEPKMQKNAFRKLKALSARRPPIFWVVGPGSCSEVFRVRYPDESSLVLEPASYEVLAFGSFQLSRPRHDV